MNTRFDLLQARQSDADHDPAAARDRLDQRRIPQLGTDPVAEAARYQVDDDLRCAVNMALTSGSPLLLTGEPGTGKSMVAHHLAWYFGLPEPFVYVVHSNTEAQDLKYEFDAVAYLRDAYDQGAPPRPRTDPAYFRKHALWQAYDHSREQGPCVLLIDEIDKAPRDFPNDLLLELERHRFAHPFEPGTAHEVAADPDHPPILVITSNAERRLPDAFLRRCIYHHIELTPQLLRTAVDAHRNTGEGGLHLDDATVEQALQAVQRLRAVPGLDKKPSTAEVLLWLTLLSARGVGDRELAPERLDKLPLVSALIKGREDLKRVGNG